MQSIRFSAVDAPESVEVLIKAFDSIVDACHASHGKETGGILIGKYVERGMTAEIIEALPPSSDSAGTASTFHRGTDGISKELGIRWTNTGSHYVGEWHFHPLGNGQPSARDVNQMIDFAREEDMQSPIPIMVIVFPSGLDLYDMRVFLFTQGGRMLELGKCAKVQEKSQ